MIAVDSLNVVVGHKYRQDAVSHLQKKATIKVPISETIKRLPRISLSCFQIHLVAKKVQPVQLLMPIYINLEFEEVR
jgi:hypothetical protein